MIINCICGKKKFRLSDELMPAEGSKVRCGACSEVWFFHPTQGNQAEIDQEIDKTYDNQISSETTESQDQTYETPVEEFSETTDIVEDEVSTDNQNKNLTSFKIFTDDDDDLPSKEEMDKNLDNYKVDRESNKSFFSKLFKKDRMQLAAESLEKKKNEEISEEELKRGLVAALNELLEPVRDHFTNNEEAKNLLALVRQYKKEALPKDSKVRRLNLVELGKVSAGSHLVFAPLPSTNPTLQDAMDILNLLKKANGKACILFLSDWSATVCNSCDADKKGISAYYSVLLTALKSLDPTLMESVQVLMQSEAILSDPSNYWISVINVGRHFSLNDVMGPDMKDSEGAGIVVSRLMRVADVAGVEPASLAFVEGDKNASVDASLIKEFFAEKLPGLSQPQVNMESGPSLLLQQRESEAHKTENDEYYLLDDPKVHGKSKMKKAFCEPKNIDFCPPIALASAFSFGFSGSSGELTIKRSAENGGDIVFKSIKELEASFADESLHPGDLKAVTSQIMVSILDKITSGVKTDPDTLKASKSLKALHKKLAKKGKK